jgi:magnesium transporter
MLDRAPVDWEYHGDGFVWIGLFEPSAHELRQAGEKFGLDPSALVHAVESHHRPKLEHASDEILFAVFRTVRYVLSSALTATSEVVESGKVMVFCGPGFVLTVRQGEHSELSGLRAAIESDPDRLAGGPGAVLHAIADQVVDGYLDVAAKVQADIDRIETEMFSPGGWRIIDRVYQLKREVLELKRAVSPLGGPMRALAERPHPLIGPEIRTYFRDVDDHLNRVRDQVTAYDELLTSILQAGLAQSQVSENEDMRRISSWVAILAVPTMIAGVYGMNFDDMPELRTRYGYFVVLAVMATACLVLFGLFKRNRWL